MTSCSNSSCDSSEATGTSDVEDHINQSDADRILYDHEQHMDDEVVTRSPLKMKPADVQCIESDVAAVSDVADNTQQAVEDASQLATAVEACRDCNGMPAEINASADSEFKNVAGFTDNKPCDSVTACTANGLIFHVDSLTAAHVGPSSVNGSKGTSNISAACDLASSSTSSCTSQIVNSESRQSLTNSIPLLSIPSTDQNCDEKNFSILPSLSPPVSEDSAGRSKSPSIYNVPCTGKELDSFTEINLDDVNVDEVELRRNANTLNVTSALSVESSRDNSPSRLQLNPSISSLPLDDAIVQSVLCDDDDEDDHKDVSHALGSARHSTTIAFSTNTDSAAFRTPSCTASSTVPLDEEGLHVVEPDSGSFEEISLQSSYGSEPRSPSLEQPSSVSGSKRSSLTNFLSRNLLFSRKNNAEPANAEGTSEVPGWKLFGRIPLKPASERDPSDISHEYRNTRMLGTGKPESGPSSKLAGNAAVDSGQVTRRSDKEVPSTTALILEHRPDGLPSKSPDDILRHQLMYDEMVEAARKKERKDAKVRKQRQEQQRRHEEQLCSALRIWNAEILPNWDICKATKKTHDLWWNGLPPSVRGRVWKLAIGNDLNVTQELYEICLVRARDKLKILQDAGTSSDTDSISSFTESSGNRESSVELIKLDVSRTFPQLCIFQQGGPYHQTLQGLLGAYACYRPDVGYVQGMSFIAAVLLLNMDDTDTFICFANLLNKPCEVAFFRLDENLMKAYFETYQLFFRENLPQLFGHFSSLHVTPDIYIIDWMYTLFAKSLPLDVASRVWDVFCRDGEEFLFRTALGILRMYEDILMRLDFIHLAQFLTRLPDNISDVELFESVGQIRMTSVTKQRFSQVFAGFREQFCG